jgi:hypothetical protein
MSLDWCPGIRDACEYWRDAPMLQQTFEALERTFEQDNDACIDCAKSIVEVFCRIIVDELDSPIQSVKPKAAAPDFGEWVGAAVRVLKLGENDDGEPELHVLLPGNEYLAINVPVSRLLYQLDRDAYIEALNAARGVPVPAAVQDEEQGEA